MASREELIAAYKTVAGVEAVINADSLGYVSHKGLVDAVGIPEENLCMGCLTGLYPVEIPGEKCMAPDKTLGISRLRYIARFRLNRRELKREAGKAPRRSSR